MWTILKLSTSTSDITKGATEMVFKTAQGLAMTTRFIPLTGADGQPTTMSLGGASQYFKGQQQQLEHKLSGTDRVDSDTDDVSKNVSSFFGKEQNQYSATITKQQELNKSMSDNSIRQTDDNFYNNFKVKVNKTKGDKGIKLNHNNNTILRQAIGNFILHYKINKNKPLIDYFFKNTSPDQRKDLYTTLSSGKFGALTPNDFKGNSDVNFSIFLENLLQNKADKEYFKNDEYIPVASDNKQLNTNKVINNIYK